MSKQRNQNLYLSIYLCVYINIHGYYIYRMGKACVTPLFSFAPCPNIVWPLQCVSPKTWSSSCLLISVFWAIDSFNSAQCNFNMNLQLANHCITRRYSCEHLQAQGIESPLFVRCVQTAQESNCEICYNLSACPVSCAPLDALLGHKSWGTN